MFDYDSEVEIENDEEGDVEVENDEEGDAEVKIEQFSDAIVYASDWTVETIISQISRGNINLSPRFQRRDAWAIDKKSLFVESVILGLPIPQIVLAVNRDARGKFIVLDGKQRLLTLLQFTGGWEGKNNCFSLRGLKLRDDLNGKSYSDIKTESIEDSDQFSNYTIRSVVIKNWPNIDYLHTVFIRLNSRSTTLSPQELRQALFPGEFVFYINKRAGESKSLKALLGINEPDFRMRDVEILLRYLAFSFSVSDYSGNLKKFLDDTCNDMNRNWQKEQSNIEKKVEEFEKAIDASAEIFGGIENVGRKWTGEKFEKKFNRAVMDVIAFYFADEKIRSIALEKKENVLDSFKTLCETNAIFQKSIESTTKSMDSTINRLNLWGNELKKSLGEDFQIPIRTGKRIRFTRFWG